MDQGLQGEPVAPAGLLQHRLVQEAVLWVADAEVGDRDHALRYAQYFAQRIVAHDAHPPDAEPLGAGGEPQVLNREARAVDVGLGDAAAPEDRLRAASRRVAGDAEVQRGVQDALQLQRELLRA